MRGLYFEEFEVGRHYRHAMTRTVTEMDNVMFTSLTMNIQPLHLDAEFAKTTVHGQRVFNSLFTVALIGRAMWPVKPWGPALMAAGTAPALPRGEGLTVILNAASGSSAGAAESIGKALPRARILEWVPGTDIEDLAGDLPKASTNESR